MTKPKHNKAIDKAQQWHDMCKSHGNAKQYINHTHSRTTKPCTYSMAYTVVLDYNPALSDKYRFYVIVPRLFLSVNRSEYDLTGTYMNEDIFSWTPFYKLCSTDIGHAKTHTMFFSVKCSCSSMPNLRLTLELGWMIISNNIGFDIISYFEISFDRDLLGVFGVLYIWSWTVILGEIQRSKLTLFICLFWKANMFFCLWVKTKIIQ